MQNAHYFNFPNFDPVIFSISFISIRWYGLMYIFGFYFALWQGRKNAKINNLAVNESENILYYCFFGLFVGGRLGYILFYHPFLFFNNPELILKIWRGGMSFHGGLLGIVVVIFYFSKKLNKNFLEISDFIVPLVPFGLGIGRIGNFINDELWGRVAINVPFAVLFPNSRSLDLELSKNNLQLKLLVDQYGVLPRHASQIYEFLLEGVILFLILNYLVTKIKKVGFISAVFLIIYGLFRFFVEFFRQPDLNIGLIKNCFSMGQLLSLPMIIVGVTIMIYIYHIK